MNKETERRLQAAERRLSTRDFRIREIVIRGGLPCSSPDGPMTASFNDHMLERTPGETFERFRMRARAAAEADSAAHIVFGGLRRRPN